ncbi:MAG: ferritin-like domain-containing protein [Arenicella sp.]
MKTPKNSLFLETLQDSRRKFIQRSGQLTMSATAVTLLAGVGTNALAKDGDSSKQVEQDIRILNTAIAAEHEAVAAYQLGAESGLLETGVLNVAVAFQGHHKEHIDALSKAVTQLGGSAAGAKKSYQFPVEKLKQQKDVLEFAAGLERGAVSAYAGAIPAFENRDLSAAAASILADEAMHWAVLRNALGLDPVPGAFFS